MTVRAIPTVSAPTTQMRIQRKTQPSDGWYLKLKATVRTACQSGKGRRRNSAHTTPPITMTSAPMANVAGQYQTGPRLAGNRSNPVAVELVPDVPRSQPGADGRVHVAFPDGETHERGATTVLAGTRRPLSATTRPRQSRTRYRSNEGVESVRCMPGSWSMAV